MMAVKKRLSDYSSFQEWIWELWIESGLEKAADFAARANVSQQNMSQYLNGKATPTPATVIKMATALGVDKVDLLKLAGHGPATLKSEPSEPPARGDAPGILLFGGGEHLTPEQKDELARRLQKTIDEFLTDQRKASEN